HLSQEAGPGRARARGRSLLGPGKKLLEGDLAAGEPVQGAQNDRLTTTANFLQTGVLAVPLRRDDPLPVRDKGFHSLLRGFTCPEGLGDHRCPTERGHDLVWFVTGGG